jgi:hypothetical protein
MAATASALEKALTDAASLTLFSLSGVCSDLAGRARRTPSDHGEALGRTGHPRSGRTTRPGPPRDGQPRRSPPRLARRALPTVWKAGLSLHARRGPGSRPRVVAHPIARRAYRHSSRPRRPGRGADARSSRGVPAAPTAPLRVPRLEREALRGPAPLDLDAGRRPPRTARALRLAPGPLAFRDGAEFILGLTPLRTVVPRLRPSRIG